MCLIIYLTNDTLTRQGGSTLGSHQRQRRPSRSTRAASATGGTSPRPYRRGRGPHSTNTALCPSLRKLYTLVVLKLLFYYTKGKNEIAVIYAMFDDRSINCSILSSGQQKESSNHTLVFAT